MAVLMPKTMGALNEVHKPVYPLFQKTSKQDTGLMQDAEALTSPSTIPEGHPQKANKGRTPKEIDVDTESKILSNPNKKYGPPYESEDVEDGRADLIEVDPNAGRRKRRKTTSPESKISLENGLGSHLPSASAPRTREIIASDNASLGSVQHKYLGDQTEGSGVRALGEGQGSREPEILARSLNKGTLERESEKPSSAQPEVSTPLEPVYGQYHPDKLSAAALQKANTGDKPQKVLHFNLKSGTLGSPPSKKTARAKCGGKQRVGRPRKEPKTRIVIFRYGDGHALPLDIGQKIEAILNGTCNAASLCNKTMELPKIPISTKVVGIGPASAPHPFFLLKAGTEKIQEKVPKNMPSLDQEDSYDSPGGHSTPGYPNTQVRRSLPNSMGYPKNQNGASMFARFGNTARTLRFPGAIEPAWPFKGMVHVRGNDSQDIDAPELVISNSRIDLRKKSKYAATEVRQGENIISELATDLSIKRVVKNIQEINLDDYPPSPSLQRMVCKELRTKSQSGDTEYTTDSDENPLHSDERKPPKPDPVLVKLFKTIGTTLSAFDKYECETQLWAQKYAPVAALDVLHNSRESQILKEWLQKLTVMSVESTSAEKIADRSLKHSGSLKQDAAGKRKRKSKKLDDFIVSDGEEEDWMDEVSDRDDGSLPSGSQPFAKKTVIRTSDATKGDGGKLANGVVISGPHGCGKTAAVYAIAKELGFEVFEINPGSRRSGKDIIDRVGDMTRNHLVRGANKQKIETVDMDIQRIDDALNEDLKSGRQGTMNSFFKPKPKLPQPVMPNEKEATSDIAPKVPAKSAQKQSLILLEEIDILYEEDKNFWTTVMTMMIESKRPIIMTCTDESAVPLDALSLYAILRFTAPTIDIAADYLLLVAANEGHLIRREAVETLYESRNMDLRASMMELNYWCQFGVGNERGGVDWFYSRWPMGSDVDEAGNTIRVVSEETYRSGMGWLSQDFLNSEENYLNIEEEMLLESKVGWELDSGDWHRMINFTDWANTTLSESKRKEDKMASLAIYDDFAQAMSDSDICSGSTFAPENKMILDASLPALTPKAREDYILSREVLDVAPLDSFEIGNVTRNISISIRSRARYMLQLDQHAKYGPKISAPLQRPDEAHINSLIRKKTDITGSPITRRDFSLAFDPISEPEKKHVWSQGSALELSSFDRSLNLIALDIAPYVRSIVSYDSRLQDERLRLSNLLSEGGKKGKRMRTTRAAMSALEGGARSTTRKEKYFGAPTLNPYLVLKTGLRSWLEAAEKGVEKDHDFESDG
ncbi:hypothetical protein B0O99DRAFT_610815 [Bisporella sp. PMI_857]|nr:hypothetical protein B0O99DRAFT_610815 [Bisporella sp. PMI_857]